MNATSTSVNADSASAYQEFWKSNNITLNVLPSGFHSNGTINISEINGVHSQLETWLNLEVPLQGIFKNI